MAGKCDVCGKVPMVGRSIRLKARTSKWVRRAHKTSKVFHPNIQKTTISINGMNKQINACTRCLRTMAKTA